VRALVWFRSDLRVADNPALHHACRDADRGVLAVFLVAERQWREHEWGDAKVDVVRRSVAALRGDLLELNVPLLIRAAARFEDAPAALLELAAEHGCEALYFNEEYEVNERRRDEAVCIAFAAAGRECRSFHDQTVLPPALLRTVSGYPYTVFTPFRNAWFDHLSRHGLPPPLPVPSPQAALPCPPDRMPARLGKARPVPALAELWPAGSAEAQRRLERFAEAAMRAYQERRDLPGEDATSRLSPYLAAGVVSVRHCLEAAVAAGGGALAVCRPGATAWITELVWREFYRHVLLGFPRVSMGRPFKLVTEKVSWRQDEEALAAWQEGRTGVPIVDAGMRELVATGWMHNRVRMIAAQFLAKQLLLDWRLGERHFMRHLADADLANNNGGWQWSASTGTDAAPYFRVFNPYTQGRRYDPDGRYVGRWVAELSGLAADVVHDEAPEATAARIARGYPAPIVDQREARQRAVDAFKLV